MLDAQTAALKDYIARQPGWMMVADYEECASAKDITGRPVLQQLLRDAQDAHFDLVLVHRLDRLARGANTFLEIMDSLDRFGVALSLASELVDTSTPTGQGAVQILRSLAEAERGLTIARMKEGARRKGK